MKLALRSVAIHIKIVYSFSSSECSVWVVMSRVRTGWSTGHENFTCVQSRGVPNVFPQWKNTVPLLRSRKWQHRHYSVQRYSVVCLAHSQVFSMRLLCPPTNSSEAKCKRTTSGNTSVCWPIVFQTSNCETIFPLLFISLSLMRYHAHALTRKLTGWWWWWQ